MRRVTLYTRPGCHLCEEAEGLLAALAADFGWEINERDITTDPMLWERFRYRVPVVAVDDTVLLYPPITSERLLEALAEGSR
jgi:glutaredoxin